MTSTQTVWGLNLDQPPTFFEGFTPKTHLAECLNVARSTVVNWDKLAFSSLPEYMNSYPKRPQGKLNIVSPDREAFLNPYQCWVLQKIGRLMASVRRAYQVQAYLKQNPQEFSQNAFQATYSQIRKSA
ncbi:hypothetical protein H6G04_29985 [Calothrix membranacea FACHB-236]|nr:hypothetical protein [Calothrix membranacea FACHB-236]